MTWPVRKLRSFFVSSLNFGDFVGVVGDDLVDERIRWLRVSAGSKPISLARVAGSLSGGVPEGGEELFGLVVGDGAILDEVEEASEAGGGNGVVGDFDGFFVEEGEEVVDDPVGDFFSGGLGGFCGVFEVGGESLVGGEGRRRRIR